MKFITHCTRTSRSNKMLEFTHCQYSLENGKQNFHPSSATLNLFFPRKHLTIEENEEHARFFLCFLQYFVILLPQNMNVINVSYRLLPVFFFCIYNELFFIFLLDPRCYQSRKTTLQASGEKGNEILSSQTYSDAEVKPYNLFAW